MDNKENLSLPIAMKPFRVRTQEAWTSFLAGEEELRSLIDRRVSESLVARCSELLSPAFVSPAFELGRNGEKYELILSPEGDRTRLFQLAYFRKRAPKELLDKWNVIVGCTRARSFGLRMSGQEVTLEDVQAWVAETENGGLGLQLYCEKLAPLKKEDENLVYSILSILLDQALGELAAMRYVDYLDILDAPEAGECVTLDKLTDFVTEKIDPRGWERCDDPEAACERYTAYKGTPSQEEDWALRQDVFAGMTCCVPLINAYFQGDSYYMDRLHQDGVVPGFFYYPLDGVDQKDILDLRDKLEEAILGRCGEGVAAFTGGATGTALGYLDFIAWDLRVLLDTAVEVFAEAPMDWAAFHTFRRNADGIGLKQAKEE